MLPIIPSTTPWATVSEFVVGERHIAGDAYPGLARFDEFEAARGIAHRLGRRAARLERVVVEFGLGQHEFVAAAEIGELAAEQPRPGQRVRMAGKRVGHRLMKPRQRRAVRRDRPGLLDAGPKRRERSNNPRALGSLASSPRKG